MTCRWNLRERGKKENTVLLRNPRVLFFKGKQINQAYILWFSSLYQKIFEQPERKKRCFKIKELFSCLAERI